MGQIVITLPDNKIRRFIKFIKEFDPEVFVFPLIDGDKIKSTSGQTEKEIKDLFGIWEKSDISLEKIRSRVWPGKAI